MALILVLVVTQPRYRQGVWVHACCFYLLILWFAMARTKTVTWAGVTRMFAFGVTWSWVIAFVSFRLGAASGVGIDEAGPGSAIAAFTEESLKLVPLGIMTLVAPGRVRRLAAIDWLLLGLASGLGFQAWEDLLRRTVTAVRPPDLIGALLGGGDDDPRYSWSPTSGGFGNDRGGLIYGYAGHHIFTAMIAGAVGLAVALWRRPGASTLGRLGGRVVDLSELVPGSELRSWPTGLLLANYGPLRTDGATNWPPQGGGERQARRLGQALSDYLHRKTM